MTSKRLVLLPFDYDAPDSGFSHTVLTLDVDQLLFDRINTCVQVALTSPLGTYLGDSTASLIHAYGATTRDAFYQPVKWTRSDELRKKMVPVGKLSPKNKAIWAYLSNLPGTTRVLLYWVPL